MREVALLVLFPVEAWLLAWAARKVGSTRGRLRYGLLASMLIKGVALFVWILAPVAKPASFGVMLAVALLVVALELSLAFMILRRFFGLGFFHALVPMGTFVALVIPQAILALAVIMPMICETFVVPALGMSPR